VHVEVAKHLENGLAAHPCFECVVAILVEHVVESILGQDLSALERRLFGVEHHIALAVEHALEVLERDVQDCADAARKALEEPDVRHRRRQGDVTQALTANLALNHLDAALLADDASMLHALVLAANALVVFDRSEDLRAEQAVALRLERTVVDRLGLFHFAV
jgi:hypothetical protein